MKVELVKYFRPILEECFASDQELLDKWHVEAPAPLDTCVERTVKDLTIPSLTFYKIVDKGGVLLGYFCKEYVLNLRFMTGFFIMPKYRTAKGVKSFWDAVHSEIEKPFFVGLYKKNKRAIRFIKKAGGYKSLDAPEHRGEYYLIKEDIQCHSEA